MKVASVIVLLTFGLTYIGTTGCAEYKWKIYEDTKSTYHPIRKSACIKILNDDTPDIPIPVDYNNDDGPGVFTIALGIALGVGLVALIAYAAQES